MNRLVYSRRQRELLYFERWQVRSKPDPVKFVSVRLIRHDGLQLNLESLAVAQRSQLDGTAVALLQKGQHGVDGVERQAIDGENLVARLEAGFRRRHSGFDLADAN